MSTQMKCPYCNGIALVSSTGRMWCANCKIGSGKQEDDMSDKQFEELIEYLKTISIQLVCILFVLTMTMCSVAMK